MPEATIGSVVGALTPPAGSIGAASHAFGVWYAAAAWSLAPDPF